MPGFSRSNVFGCVLVGLISTVFTTALRANSLPAAVIVQTFTTGVLYSGGPDPYGLGIYESASYTSIGGSLNVNATAFGVAGGDPSTFIHLQGAGMFPAPGLGLHQFDLRSSVAYYLEVTAPTDTTTTIHLTGGGIASTGFAVPTFGAESILTLAAQSTPTSYLLDGMACSGDTSKLINKTCSAAGSPGNSFTYDDHLTLQTNTVYMVSLWSEAYFGPTGAYSLLDAFTGVDPTISLDTTDPEFSLEFSPGVTAAAPAPEPSTIWLLVTGVAAVGMRVRRIRSHG